MNRPDLRGALFTVLTGAVFCSPLVTFSSILVRDAFHGGSARFSSAVAAFGVGGLLGAAALLNIKPTVDRRWLSAGFAILHGASVLLAALTPWFWGLPVLFVTAGAAMTISNTSANSLLQMNAGDHQLGQTVSLYMLAMRGGSSIGALLMGVAVSALGVQSALALSGAVAIALQAWIAAPWLRTRVAEQATSVNAG